MTAETHAIRRINVEARYSDVAIHNGVAYLAGQVPEDASADAATQVHSVLTQIDRLLAAAQSSKAHLLMVTVYLADLADYAVLNQVWDAWVSGIRAPPRATVQACLANPGWRVEIVVTAAVGGQPG